MPITDTTTNRGYAKPNIANALSDDVTRLRTGLDSIDTDVATLLPRLLNTANGAASSPPGLFSGTWFTGGTGTSTKPQLLIEPSGTTSTAWSTSGTGLGINGPTGFTGRLLDLQLAGTSNFSVDSTGRVSFPLGLVGTPSLYPGTDTDTGFWSPTGDTLAVSTGGSERARIDSSGRLLVGTNSSVVSLSGLGAFLQVNEGSGVAASLLRSTADANGANLVFRKTRGTTPTDVTIVNDGDSVAQIVGAATDGAASIPLTRITFAVDGAPGLNDMPGRIVFSTTADGTNGTAERLRITNDGIIAYNQPAPAAVNATATLTIANLKAGIITSTSAAATDMTLPTGTLTEAGFSGVYTNFTFEWSVINTGPSLVRVLDGTGHTVTGSGSVAAGTSARFASRRTASNTFVAYRLA